MMGGEDEYIYLDEFQDDALDNELASTAEQSDPLHQAETRTENRETASPKNVDLYKEMLDFNSFCLRPELLQALKYRQFSRPSPAQVMGLPVALNGHDLLLQGKGGSGKTAVYCLAALQTMQFVDDIKVLTIVPTRELALQVANEFQIFSEFLPECRVQSLFGGVGEMRDRVILDHKRPNIVVGTPGRLLALLRRKRLNLRRVTHFIIDECDKILCPGSGGMSSEVRELLEACPEERQVMMFTGTINRSEAEREQRFMKLMHCPRLLLAEDPSQLILTGVSQFFVSIRSEAEKTRQLLEILDKIEYNQVVIFVNTVERCQALCDVLNNKRLECIPFHSGIEQVERLKNFCEFKHFFRRILVATDVMGRGIDYEFVTCVINYDVPLSADIYMHRVGRTGRMLKRGIAVSLCVSEENSRDVRILQLVENRYLTQISELPQTLDTNDLL